MTIITLFSGFFLAFSNGANDGFKGVATLYGSRAASYRISLMWATLTTLAGSVLAIFLAKNLMLNFSAKGLVPDDIVHFAPFALSVTLSAALTVFLATRIGFPISTTHAITGALVGAGLTLSPAGVNGSKLLFTFVIPLLTSPFIAFVAAGIFFPALRWSQRRFSVRADACVCVGQQELGFAANPEMTMSIPSVTVGNMQECSASGAASVVAVEAVSAVRSVHFLSAGAVSFARGLNDTPKIAALLLLSALLPTGPATVLVALIMAIGGFIFSERIAETMAHKITEMSETEALSANLVTSAIVLGASFMALPVSTTHVSCGALFGIGSASGKANWSMIGKIILAWVVTLPVAAGIGGGLGLTLKLFI